VEFIKTVVLLIVGSGITLCSQIFLKWKDRTEKKKLGYALDSSNHNM